MDQGFAHSVGHVGGPEAGEDILGVFFDRVLLDAQDHTDLPIGFSACGPQEDFYFPRREFEGRFRRIETELHDPFMRVGTDEMQLMTMTIKKIIKFLGLDIIGHRECGFDGSGPMEGDAAARTQSHSGTIRKQDFLLSGYR